MSRISGALLKRLDLIEKRTLKRKSFVFTIAKTQYERKLLNLRYKSKLLDNEVHVIFCCE